MSDGGCVVSDLIVTGWFSGFHVFSNIHADGCFASQGDVQMAVSILLVLGDKGRSLVPDDKQEQWYLAYVGKL